MRVADGECVGTTMLRAAARFVAFVMSVPLRRNRPRRELSAQRPGHNRLSQRRIRRLDGALPKHRTTCTRSDRRATTPTSAVAPRRIAGRSLRERRGQMSRTERSRVVLWVRCKRLRADAKITTAMRPGVRSRNGARGHRRTEKADMRARTLASAGELTSRPESARTRLRGHKCPAVPHPQVH